MRLKGDAIDFMHKHQKTLDTDEKVSNDTQFVVVLNYDGIKTVENGMKITFGPDTADIDEVMNRYAGIKNFCYKTSHVGISDHSGEFKFDFCRGCPEKPRNG